MTNKSIDVMTLSEISTHPLRKEGDRRTGYKNTDRDKFQPTPSARRVTTPGSTSNSDIVISTHTLRKEGDEFEKRMKLR